MISQLPLTLDHVVGQAKGISLKQGVLPNLAGQYELFAKRAERYKKKLITTEADQEEQGIGIEFDPEINDGSGYLQKLMRNHCYLPQIYLSSQMQNEFSRALDDSYIYDRRNVGSIVGMTILGMLGFVVLGFTIFGLIAGGALGIVIGRYAGRRLRKQYQNKKVLVEYDVYEIRVRCYIKWATARASKYRFNLNLLRFIVEKLVFELKPLLHYKQFKETQKAYAKKLLSKAAGILKDDKYVNALILSLKLSEEYLRILKLLSEGDMEVSRREVEEIAIYRPFRGEIEVCLMKAVDNVLKPMYNLFTETKVTGQRLSELLRETKKFLINPDIIVLSQQFPDPQMTIHFIKMLAEKMSQQIKPIHLAAYVKQQNFKDIEQLQITINQIAERIQGQDGKYAFNQNPLISTKHQIQNVILEVPNDFESEQEQFQKLEEQKPLQEPIQQIELEILNNSPVCYQSPSVEEKEQQSGPQATHQASDLKLNLKQHPNRAFMNKLTSRPGDEDQFGNYSPKRSLSKHDVLQILEPERSISQIQFQKLEMSASQSHAALNYTAETLHKFQIFLDYYHEPVDTWEQVIKKDEIFIYKAMKPGCGSVFIKGYAYIDKADKDLVFNAVYNKEFRTKWDKIMQGFDIVRSESEQIDIMYYYVAPPIAIVSTREWLQRRVLRRDFPEKGQICLMFYSVELGEIPVKKDRVRAHTEIAGYVFENTPQGAKISFISNNDIKGSIPKLLVNHASAKGPFGWFGNLRKACALYQQVNGDLSKINIK